MAKLDDTERAAWRALLGAHAVAVEQIELALATKDLPPLAWYDVLWALQSAPGRSLRLSELADAVVLSRSWLSRLVDRLVREGLITRETCQRDRRAVDLSLTPDGRAMLKHMWPTYSAAIAAHFARHVADAEALAALLAPVAAARPG